MIMGEESHEQDGGASCSWWLDSQTTQPHQSQWLQATLSDLDKKMSEIVTLMEGGGDSFAKRAEMCYNNRPQFIKMVQDLHKSYHSLAEKYDQIRYESVSSSYKNTQVRKTRSLENSKLEASILDAEYELLNKKEENNDVENWVDVSKLEQEDSKWSEMNLHISHLINENKKQQAGLIRRNEEKMKEIKALYENLDKLKEENKSLKFKLAQCKADMNQNRSHLSKFKRMVLGK